MAIKKQTLVTKNVKDHAKSTDAVLTCPVRVSIQTKKSLDTLLDQANRNRSGRKVKSDDLIRFAIGFLTDDHVMEICERTLTNKDRVEILYQKLHREQKGLS